MPITATIPYLTPLDADAIRRDFPVLERTINGRPLIYLDSAATSQKPRVMIERIVEIYGHEYARPEEGHALSREATHAFEKTRERVRHLINGAEKREVIFTRGATEALFLASVMVKRDGLTAGDEILLTEAEHHSNIVPWLMAAGEAGATVRAAPILPNGDLDMERFAAMLSERTRIACVTHCSNVTGAVFPVKEATRLAHEAGALVLVDGAQAVPHMPVDVRDIDCDFYTGSGHKMGGPSSVGFLWGKGQILDHMPVADGGSMMSDDVSFTGFTAKPIPEKYEAGEPPFGEVEAWGPAIDYWLDVGMDRIAAYEEELATYAADRLARVKGVRVLGNPTRRLSVVSFVVDGMDASDVAEQLDAEGIATRAGKLAAQPHLEALGVKKAVRASFTFYNTRDEADFLVECVSRLVG